jgi:hypothetical protein
MTSWQPAIPLSLVPSLLAGMAVLVLTALSRVLHLGGRGARRIRLKQIACSLALLALLAMPALLSLLRGSWLSLGELALYAKQALISTAVVLSFALSSRITREALSAPDLWTYIHVNVAQVRSLAKIRQGDNTGWHELWEDVRFGAGLRIAAHIAAHVAVRCGTNVSRKRQLRLLLS